MKPALTPQEIQALQAVLPTLSPAEKLELLQDLEERASRASQQIGRDSLLGFAMHVYPGFKIGPRPALLTNQTWLPVHRRFRVVGLSSDVRKQAGAYPLPRG